MASAIWTKCIWSQQVHNPAGHHQGLVRFAWAVAATERDPSSMIPSPPKRPALQLSPSKGSPSSLAASPSKGEAETPLTLKQKKKELRNGMSTHMKGLNKDFARYDLDDSGEIDLHEFTCFLQSFDLPFSDDPETVDDLFDDMDFDGSKTLSADEILRYALVDILSRSKDRIHDLCKLYDYDCNGTVNLVEFARVMESLGLEVPMTAIEDLFNQLDEDKTGELVYEEFTRKLKNQSGKVTRLAEEASRAKPRNEKEGNALDKFAAKRRAAVAMQKAAEATMLAARLAKAPPPTKVPDPTLWTRSSSLPPSDDEAGLDDDGELKTPRGGHILTPRANSREGKMLLASYTGSLPDEESIVLLPRMDNGSPNAYRSAAVTLLSEYKSPSKSPSRSPSRTSFAV